MTDTTNVHTTLHIDEAAEAPVQRAALAARMTALEVAMEANTELTREASLSAKQAIVDATAAALAAAQPIKEKADASYAMTLEIRDLLRAGKAGLAVLKYLGMLATPAVAVMTAWHYFMDKR